MRSRVAGLLPAALLAALAPAAPRASGGGSSGAEFLRAGMGARPAALGENFTGLADDVTAAGWNPAGLGRLDRMEFSGMHFASIGDVNYEFVAASYPVGSAGSLAVSAAYVGAASFDSTAPGSGIAPATATDTTAALSWGGSFRGLGGAQSEYANAYYGATARFISRSLGGYAPAGGPAQTLNATGFAADAGLLYQASRVLSAGLSVLNIGTPMTFLGDEADALPLTVRAGLAWTAVDAPSVRAVVLADVVKPVDADGGVFASATWGGAGAEAVLFKMLALRGGFRLAADGMHPVGGAGVQFALGTVSLGLDGAIVQMGDLGTGWRAGLTVKLGAAEKRLAAPATPTAEAVPGKKVTVRWSPVYGAAGYQVELRTPGAPSFRRVTKAPRAVPELTLTLKGQKAGAEYAFRVIAVTESGHEGLPAEVAWIAPAEVVAAVPAAPAALKVRLLKGRKVHLAWTPVAGASGYMVFIKGAAGKWSKLTKVPRPAPTMTLKGIKPGSYTFGVVAVNAEGKQGKAKATAVRLK